MQLSACFSGATWALGNDRCCRSVKSRVVRARIRVSILERELSRARRTSVGEKRLKTSSVDSGSSQNFCALVTSVEFALETHSSPIWILRCYCFGF
jgi:hypothetical protein